MCHHKAKVLLLSICLAGLFGNYVQAVAPPGSYQVQIVAADMCCKGCAQKVAGQLYAAPGVTEVNVNLNDKTVLVTVSLKKGATLEQLWQAVAVAKGDPTTLTTNDATFTLTLPEALDESQRLPETTSYVVVENLTEAGRAQNIATKLYAIRGVDKVGVDAQQNTLIVTTQQVVSPWALIGAVATAEARPVAVLGAYGRMSIEWTATKDLSNQQAHQTHKGGIQR